MNKQENLILSFFIKNSKYLLFLILFSNAINCKAQLNNLWYFGNNAGLDFSTFPPKSISSNFPKYYHSHVAQCNNDGKLLFYSNGTSVFNSTGQIMQNGNNLLSNCGNNDSISSVLKCIKLYTDSNIYYLFYNYQPFDLFGFCHVRQNL